MLTLLEDGRRRGRSDNEEAFYKFLGFMINATNIANTSGILVCSSMAAASVEATLQCQGHFKVRTNAEVR